MTAPPSPVTAPPHRRAAPPPRSAPALFSALAANTSLTMLSLNNCVLGAGGAAAAALARALGCNASLQHLRLNDTDLSDADTGRVLDALAYVSPAAEGGSAASGGGWSGGRDGNGSGGDADSEQQQPQHHNQQQRLGLLSLGLTAPSLGAASAAALGRALSSPHSQLQSLSVTCRAKFVERDAEVAKQVARGIMLRGTASALRELHLELGLRRAGARRGIPGYPQAHPVCTRHPCPSGSVRPSAASLLTCGAFATTSASSFSSCVRRSRRKLYLLRRHLFSRLQGACDGSE